ncbi:MAG: bifunctional histidinol-phosphatase/imidazoleglycerol-phosphate dehydratase HisB [Flavobacteriaceae bacterium]|tara:strand:- start:2484 stop:3614 length:1131 start_codon:yes stop_codon:yes gene_type:complete
MKKILFIDRDGTLVNEPKDYQLDSFEKLSFYPKVFNYLSKIYNELDYKLIVVTNQDGLGTDSFPYKNFTPVNDFIIKSFENEGVVFDNICIDNSFPDDNSANRKPSTGMIKKYLNNKDYDIDNSFVIGDRLTDMELAKNISCSGIFIDNDADLGKSEVKDVDLDNVIKLKTKSWEEIYTFLKKQNRTSNIQRVTGETNVFVELNLDGSGKSDIKTGISFFDHMLDQLAKHSGVDLIIDTKGDLNVDEHHTIEDTGITLGKAFFEALGKKIGIERYGFCLPMDDCLAQVSIDFGGRNWIEWDVEFKREMIGKMPTEMFFHFFKSFSDSAKANINIKADGLNEHHKIESIFKAFAKSIKAAIKRDKDKMILPSTKGEL